MIGSYAIGQQTFLEQANVSERCHPEPADLSESEAIQRAQRGDADALARIYQCTAGVSMPCVCAWREILLKPRISPRMRS